MRVMILADWPGHGLSPQLVNLGRAVAMNGASVVLATGDQDATRHHGLDESDNDIQTRFLPHFFKSSNPTVAGVVALIEALNEEQVEVLHCQGYGQLVASAIASRFARGMPKLCLTDHSSGGWSPGLRRTIRCLLLRRIESGVICLNRDHYQTIGNLLGDEDQIAYIGNPVDTSKFRPRNVSDMANKEEQRELIYVGSLKEGKGHKDLIEIAGSLRDGHVDISIDCYGSGPLYSEIAEEIARAELEDIVVLHGRVLWPELVAGYSQATLGVFPSYHEMMPNALLEMLASGLPVVAYAIPGVSDVIEHGQNGFLVDVGAVDRFVLSIEHLLKNRQLREEMSHNARATAKEFDLPVIGNEVCKLYGKL